MSRDEFAVHRLNKVGLDRAAAIGEAFSRLLDKVEDSLAESSPENRACTGGPFSSSSVSRDLAIVRTELEEACFFAKRAHARCPGNQEP